MISRLIARNVDCDLWTQDTGVLVAQVGSATLMEEAKYRRAVPGGVLQKVSAVSIQAKGRIEVIAWPEYQRVRCLDVTMVVDGLAVRGTCPVPSSRSGRCTVNLQHLDPAIESGLPDILEDA